MLSVGHKPLILASSSPRRRELIAILGAPVTVMPSEADEHVPDGTPPAHTVEALSLRKANAVREACVASGRSGIVIGSDTIVVADGRILGKPSGREEALGMLSRLQGCTHEVYTGVACVDVDAGSRQRAEGLHTNEYPEQETPAEAGRFRVASLRSDGRPGVLVGHTVSRVTFHPMTVAEMEAYVASGEPLDKAGAYGVQGLGSVFIERIEGDFFSVMGLPMSMLYRMLAELGANPLLP